MALGEVAKEIMWIRMILTELNVTIVTPSIIYVDNQPAIRISENYRAASQKAEAHAERSSGSVKPGAA